MSPGIWLKNARAALKRRLTPLARRLADVARRLWAWLTARDAEDRRAALLRRLGGLVAAVAAIALIRALLAAGGMEVRPKREMPSDAYFYYQEDADWRYDTLGQSDRMLGRDGDEVACLAAIMSMQGVPAPFEGELNPGTLNAWLNANDGYDEKGNLRWEHAASLLGMKATHRAAQGNLNGLLDELIQRAVYPIVRVRTRDSHRWHDVVLVGGVHGEFTIVDSFDPTETLNTLGAYGNRIYGVWYLEKLKE